VKEKNLDKSLLRVAGGASAAACWAADGATASGSTARVGGAGDWTRRARKNTPWIRARRQCGNIRATGRSFPSRQKLGATIGSCWSSVFHLFFKKNRIGSS